MRRLVPLALLLLVAACDRGAPERSSFEAFFTGDLDTEMTGAAGITSPDDGTGRLAIGMVEGGFGDRGLTFTFVDGEVPDEGAHAFGFDAQTGVQLEYLDHSGTGLLLASEGTLTVTHSDDDYVVGRFEGTLRNGDGSVTTGVRGSFDALRNETVLY